MNDEIYSESGEFEIQNEVDGSKSKIARYKSFNRSYNYGDGNNLVEFTDFKVIIRSDNSVHVQSHVKARQDPEKNGPKIFMELFAPDTVKIYDGEFGEFQWESNTNSIVPLPTKIISEAYSAKYPPKLYIKW